jgi:hypothetical protein
MPHLKTNHGRTPIRFGGTGFSGKKRKGALLPERCGVGFSFDVPGLVEFLRFTPYAPAEPVY